MHPPARPLLPRLQTRRPRRLVTPAFTATDHYFAEHCLRDGEDLASVLAANAEGGLPAIDVSPLQGKFLSLLARTAGARKILEIGTLGGFSTIWLARALPNHGELVTLELEPRHAEVARRNLDAAGLGDLVEIIVGPALQSLPGLTERAPFDLVFIDADKANIPGYYAYARKFTHTGSLIVVDNVVRGGRVVEADSDDPSIHGVRQFATMLATDEGVEASVLQTVGVKGHDGFALVRVR